MKWPAAARAHDVMLVVVAAQSGLFWVGACVPVGRMTADDLHAWADVAEK